MIIFGHSQDSIVRVISRATFDFYDAKKGDFNMNKFNISVNYWSEVTRDNVGNASGSAYEIARKIIDRGMGPKLSPFANSFGVYIDGDYKGVTRVTASVFDLALLRSILHSEPEALSFSGFNYQSRRSEHEVWFHKYNAWQSEYESWRNFVKIRLD